MKKYLFVINFAFCIILCSCSTTMDFESMLKKSNSLKEKRCGTNSGTYKHWIELKDKINFIDFSHDTIYLLESYSIYSGTFYGALWTNTGRIDYESHSNRLEISKHRLFIKRLDTMIENWDTTAIRNEEHKVDIHEGSPILGTRIILENRNIRLDCILFDEFFDPGKDQIIFDDN